MYVLTPEQIKDSDRKAKEKYGINEKVLMKNAGLSAVSVILRDKPDYTGNALVLCGYGNNGGDGYVVAAELALRGWTVSVAEYKPKKKRTPSSEHFRKAARKLCSFFDISRMPGDSLSSADIIVDALFGIGYRGTLPDDLEPLILSVNGAGCRKYAIDCPSGIDPLTGKVPGTAFRADVTAAMSYPTRGLYLLPGREYAGKTSVCSIGIDYEKNEADADYADTVGTPATVKEAFARRPADSNKGSYGRLAIICGSNAMPGAALLAIGGALRSGCGYCELISTSKVISAALPVFPEVIYTEIPPLDDCTQDDIDMILGRVGRSDAVLFGCGLGTGKGTAGLASSLIGSQGCPAVFDADGLNCLSASGFTAVGRKCVFTPHPLEFSRLTGIAPENTDRYEAAKTYAKEHGVTLLLKGADTVIASPDGSVHFNPTGCAALAKAGSGDVLAGLIAGILARTGDCGLSAKAGAYIHGACGEMLAERGNEHAVRSAELADMIPDFLNSIL